MSDKKKQKHHEQPAPAPVDTDIEQNDEQSDEKEVLPQEAPPKLKLVPEITRPREQTPEEIVASYEPDDAVIFRDTDGSWKEAKLTSTPQVVRSGGKVKYKFNVAGKADAVLSPVPLKRVEGVSLIEELSAKGPVTINGKEYELHIPLNDSGDVVLGAQGEEEYLLQEIGKRRNDAESKYIDVEAVKSIYEAQKARDRFNDEVQKLEQKIEVLQGIKTKELYARLGTLKKDVERIGKLMEFNVANAEDADVKELKKINAKIEQLTENIEKAVRELNRDVRTQKKTDEASGLEASRRNTEKTSQKDKQTIVAEVGEEVQEALEAADWRYEHENKAEQKRHQALLKDWEAKNKRLRDWEEAKRQGKNQSKPPHPGPRPVLNNEKPSQSKELRGMLVYDIFQKRADSDPYVQAVKKEVAKKIERVTGRKVHMDELEEEVLQLIGSDLKLARELKKNEDQFRAKQDSLDAKRAHNAPLQAELQRLQAEEVDLNKELTDIDTKAREYEMHAEQEADATEKSKQKRTEMARIVDAKLDPVREKELRDQRDLQESLLGQVRKEKEKKKINDRIAAIDAELASTNADAQRDRMQADIDALESVAFSARIAKEQLEKDLDKLGNRKQEINTRLLVIAEEQKQTKEQLQDTSNEEAAVADDKKNKLREDKASVVTDDARERARIYIGQIAEQVLESWKKQTPDTQGAVPEKSEKSFNYTDEHKQLTTQATTLKTKLAQVSNKTRQKELKAQLSGLEDRLSNLDADTSGVETEMLRLWKDMGDLEVSIDQFMPVGSDVEESEVREVREARERRVVTRELPSYMIHELLDTRKIQFGEIVKLIYEQQLKTTMDQGVEVIEANDTITNLMKGLFQVDMPPGDQMLDLLRQYGIRDWKTFKELWDTQYASHIGMMLQEDAQNIVAQRVREERMRLDSRSWMERNITSRGNPTDEQIRARVLEDIFAQDTVAGISVSDSGLEFYARLMGTAMREINMELKMSTAQTDADRAAILQSFGRKADDYVQYNGQFFIKNEEHRMIRKEDSNDIDAVLPDHEERREIVSAIDDRIEESARLLQEWRFGTLSTEDQGTLKDHVEYFQKVLDAKGDDENKTAVVLAHYLSLQDQVKDIVHEYRRMHERKGVAVFERVARSISKRGEEIKAKDKAEGGIIHKIEEAKEKTPVPAGKGGSKLKKLAIAAALAAGFVSGYYVVHHYHPGWGSPLGGAKVASQKERGGERSVEVKYGKVRDGVTDVEMRMGNPGKERSTTTSVEWNLNKISTFEEAIKKVFNNKKSQGEIFAASSSVKDIVFGIADSKDRAAAVKAVYYLGGSIMQENSVDSMEQLRDILGTNNAQESAKKLVALGSKVDAKSPHLMEAKDARPVDEMVQQTKNAPTDPSDPGSPAFQEIIKNSSFSKVDKLKPNVMKWAPLVLEQYLKVYPSYSNGAQRKDAKERLEGILFDVASTLARIGTESDGKTRDVHPTSKAMGLTQIVDSTVRSHCPGADLSDPGQQIACGMAEVLNKSNRYQGNALDMNMAYVGGPGARDGNSGGLTGYQKGAGTTDSEKVLEYLGKGGSFAGRDVNTLTAKERKQRESLMNIPGYVKKNIDLPKIIVQDHQWFNELLKDPKFKFLWEDLKTPLPEFGLTPERKSS